MATKSAMRALPLVLAAVLSAASCAGTSTASSSIPTPTEQVCNGISAGMGGCTTPRHTYVSTSCAGLAREWAAVLNESLVAILDGPAAVQDNARSVLLQRALVHATVDMNMRLRSLNLQEACDVPEFLAVAEPLFSTRLREGIGAAMFDGDPVVTYDEWMSDVRRQLRAIDDGESPAPSSAPSG